MDLKIMILGDSSVGKSSLLAEKFYLYTEDTLGPYMTIRKTIIDDKTLTVQVLIKLYYVINIFT